MAQTFIGARISLTSISDIRYRGTLHGIDHVASTIQLSNVYSMGTENRRPANEYVPPNENPYEFIIFRATEVKDLAVDQPPPQQNSTSQRSVHDDPAVIGASTAQGFGNYTPMQPPAPNPYQTPQAVAAAPPQPPVAQKQPTAPPAAPAINTNGKQRAPENPADSPVSPAANGIAAPGPAPAGAATSGARANRPNANRRNDSSLSSPVRSASASLEKVERAIGDLRLSNANANASNPSGHGGRGNRRGGPRSGGGGSRGAGAPAAVVPDTDFDFERSNAKFDKAALMSNAAVPSPTAPTASASGASSPVEPTSPPAPEKPQFYNRSRSFFDDISSDSKAKTQGEGGVPGRGGPGGRNRREEERSKNLSTFGEAGGSGAYWPSSVRDGGNGWRGGRRRKWNGGGGRQQQPQQGQTAA